MAQFTKEQRYEVLTVLVGAFIATVRKTGKAPSASILYKERYGKHFSADTARKFRAVMEATVAHIDPNGSARLYRDNRTIDELMPLVMESWNTIKTPAPKKYVKKEKTTMADLVYNEETGEFQDPNDEVHIIGSTPKQEESPKVPLFDCTGKLDLSSYKDEDLATLVIAFQKAVEEEQAARAHRTHVQKVLAVIKEMVASEGLNWEEILTADEIF